ncbi:MAG TPA: Gfo/Idh/MocA family oxidoreductase [Polyangiaceae bacterium]|nr:Gfo/Idh/MocA family oxidoreductase [Polyangiaceae bacterium]
MAQQFLQWGVIGTGAIATDFATALRASERCRIVNVTSFPGLAQPFAEKFAVPRATDSLDELLADPEVQAVYVATPHPLHEKLALAAIAAGKHVLVEKPMATSAEAAARVVEAARRRGVFLMEAYMYRCHPLVTELVSRLRAGAIGQIRHVRADFGFREPRNPRGRLFDPALAGGGVLDVGGYPVSFARLIAGIAIGKSVAEPTRLSAAGQVGPTGVDEFAQATLVFESGVTAEVACAIRYDFGCAATIFGEEGRITLEDAWLPGGKRQGLESHFTIERDGEPPEVVHVNIPRAIYALEAELVADALPAAQASWPAMTWDDTLANLRVMDQWRAALGLPAAP